MEPRVGESDRLDEDLVGRAAAIALGCAEQRALERQEQLPSPVVPSANSTIACEAASRPAISLACSPDLRFACRSI